MKAKLPDPVPEAPSGGPRHVAIIMDRNGRWATQRGRPRPIGVPFEGHDLQPLLAEVAGQSAGSGAHVEHPVTGGDPERAQEVRPLRGEVVERRPIDDPLGELVGSGRQVAHGGERPQDVILRAVRVADARTDLADDDVRHGHRLTLRRRGPGGMAASR